MQLNYQCYVKDELTIFPAELVPIHSGDAKT